MLVCDVCREPIGDAPDIPAVAPPSARILQLVAANPECVDDPLAAIFDLCFDCERELRYIFREAANNFIDSKRGEPE